MAHTLESASILRLTIIAGLNIKQELRQTLTTDMEGLTLRLVCSLLIKLTHI